ncbi:MAG: SpoIID/LytB domain-containing protein [Vicinamibacterales bacterium]
MPAARRPPHARRLALAAALAFAAGCASAPRSTPGAGPVVPDEVAVRSGGRVIHVPLEDYVLASVLSEVSPVGESDQVVARIFEVQAVIARTYAAANLGRHRAEGFDLCDGTHCQLYDPARIRTSRFAPEARAAVARTAGEILLYGRHPIEAVYHADCGGRTAAAADVWGGSLPYLTGHADDDVQVRHRTWQVRVSADALRTALNADARTRIGAHLQALSVTRVDGSGRAAALEVDGDSSRTVSGEAFRSIVNQALTGQGLMSTRFTLTGDPGRGYLFAGTGFGHGVGLCQVGAAARARAGQSVPDILEAYYPGAALVRPASSSGHGPRPFPGGSGG